MIEVEILEKLIRLTNMNVYSSGKIEMYHGNLRLKKALTKNFSRISFNIIFRKIRNHKNRVSVIISQSVNYQIMRSTGSQSIRHSCSCAILIRQNP